MAKMKGTLLVFAFCHLACCPFANASAAPLKKGNRFFVKGDYESALKTYQDALVDQPHSGVLHFNAGDAAYQMGDFDKAAREFEEASLSANRPLQAAAHYNRGNALFQQQRWGEAAEAYKKSLRLHPRDEDAKYNLGVALRMQKNPPPRRPPKSGGNDQKQSKDGAGGKKEEPEEKGPSQPQAGQMSREDAERLLSAAGAGEQKKPSQKTSKAGRPHPDEDW